MIKKSKLVKKYVRYVDGNGKTRVEKVTKVSGSYVTVVSAVKVKHRIHKDKILGRQFPKRGMEEIDWRRGV